MFWGPLSRRYQSSIDAAEATNHNWDLRYRVTGHYRRNPHLHNCHTIYIQIDSLERLAIPIKVSRLLPQQSNGPAPSSIILDNITKDLTFDSVTTITSVVIKSIAGLNDPAGASDRQARSRQEH